VSGARVKLEMREAFASDRGFLTAHEAAKWISRSRFEEDVCLSMSCLLLTDLEIPEHHPWREPEL